MFLPLATSAAPPKDDYLLMLAASSGAALLVTGDKDLLAIGNFKKVRTIRPFELMAELTA